MYIGKKTLILTLSLACLLGLLGSAWANPTADVDLYMHFALGTDNAIIPQTAGPGGQKTTAAIEVRAYWEAGQSAPGPEIKGARFEILYDANKLDYYDFDNTGCASWPRNLITVNRFENGANSRLVVLIENDLQSSNTILIDPQNPPRIENPLVFLKLLLHPKCPVWTESSSWLVFDISECMEIENTKNHLFFGGTRYWPQCSNYDHGTVNLGPYAANFTMNSQNPAYLGETVTLSVYVNTAIFKFRGVHHEILIDHPEKVQNLEIVRTGNFGYGIGLTPPDANGLFKVDVVNITSVEAPPALEVYRLRFKLAKVMNGDNCTVNFDLQTGTSYSWIGGCAGLGRANAVTVTEGSGDVTIPRYEATFKVTANTPTGMIKRPDIYSAISLNVKVKNNFPAGDNPDETSAPWPTDNITVNLDRGTSWLYNNNLVSVDPFNFGRDGCDPSFEKFRTERLAGDPLLRRNYIYPTTDFSNMFGVSLVLWSYAPTSYVNRYVSLLAPSGCSVNSQVKDTTGAVAAIYNGGNGRLSFAPNGIEVVTGEFWATNGYNGSNQTVTNEIYMRNNFNVTEFTVKVNCGSAHIITGVSGLLPGVTVTESSGSKNLAYSSANPVLPPVGSDCNGSRRIAVISYRCTARCYKGDWETPASSVWFSGSDESFMKGREVGQDGQTPGYQWVVLTAGSVRSRCIPNNPPPDPVFDKQGTGGLPSEFAVHQNYPNPFNPTTTISFDLPATANWNVSIYNVSGQLVKRFSGASGPGTVNVDWDGSAVSSGVYLYRVEAANYTETRKMILLK